MFATFPNHFMLALWLKRCSLLLSLIRKYTAIHLYWDWLWLSIDLTLQLGACHNYLAILQLGAAKLRENDLPILMGGFRQCNAQWHHLSNWMSNSDLRNCTAAPPRTNIRAKYVQIDIQSRQKCVNKALNASATFLLLFVWRNLGKFSAFTKILACLKGHLFTFLLELREKHLDFPSRN